MPRQRETFRIIAHHQDGPPGVVTLSSKTTIRSRQPDYYTTPAESDRTGSSEASVTFMLEVIRDSILPFAKPADGRNLELSRALSFFRQNPKGNVQMLAEFLGCSKRTAERIVAELKSSGDLKGVGSNRAGSWLVED